MPATAPLNSRSDRVLGADVVLQGAEVVHLVALAEVDGQQPAAAALARQGRVGADPGVVAAEGDRRRRQRGVPADPAGLEADLPGPQAERLHVEVAQPGRVGHVELGDRHGQRGDVGGRHHLDDGDLGAFADLDQGTGENGGPVGVDPVDDDDRVGHDRALGHPHRHRRRGEGGVQGRRGRRARPRCHRIGPGSSSGRPRRRSERASADSATTGLAVADDDQAAAWHRSRPAPAARARAIASAVRRSGGRPAVPVEVELVDAAVAPHLLGLGRQGGPDEPLERLRPGGAQPLAARPGRRQRRR